LVGPGWRWLELIWLAAPATPPAQPIQLSRTGWQLLASWYVKKLWNIWILEISNINNNLKSARSSNKQELNHITPMTNSFYALGNLPDPLCVTKIYTSLQCHHMKI